MKGILVTAVTAALIWLQPACNGGSDPVQTYQVGPNGGTFETPDGVKLEIPQGALDQEIEITVTKTSISTDDFDAAGDFFEFGPAGTTFNSDITLTLPYDPQKASGPEENLRLWYSDSASGPFSPLPGSADTTAKTVSGSVNHFSHGAPGSTTTITDCGNDICERPGETCTNCPNDCVASISGPYDGCPGSALGEKECQELFGLPFVRCVGNYIECCD